jgi:PBP1b-binding outer membrane lipoprotein LpoB
MRFRSVLVFLALVIAAPAAHADDTVQCEVVEIEASTTNSPTIDAALNDLAKKLSQMPFSAFNTFHQAARQSRAITAGNTESFNVTKANVDVALNTVTAATKKKKARVSLAVGITSNNKKWVDTKGSIDVGDFLMFARTVNKTSGVIYAVGCH